MKGRSLLFIGCVTLVCCVAAVAGLSARGRHEVVAAARAQTPGGVSQGPDGTASGAVVARPPLNKAAYDAKMLELANRRPQRGCVPAGAAASMRSASAAAAAPRAVPVMEVSGDSGTKASGSGLTAEAKRRRAHTWVHKAAPKHLRPCAPYRWPVHAVYPEAGAILPFHRIVAYYGNFYSTHMGILGQYPEDEVLQRLQATVAEWQAASPDTPVLPGLDYIATSAQAAPGGDGMYRLRMSDKQIQKAIAMANQAHALLFLDVQPGWSTVKAEVGRLEPYLKLPNVELALDPEFALVPGRRPGAWRGTMGADEINQAARILAKVVDENHLSPKILVVHRFTQRMVSHYAGIEPLPQVQIVMDMDGFGAPSRKTAAYQAFIARQPVQFTGFKLFYHNDVKWGGRLMTPQQILALSPRPSYIVYQ